MENSEKHNRKTPMLRRRWVRAVLLVGLIALSLLVAFVARPALKIGTGYGALVLGQAVFLGGRDPANVVQEDLGFLYVRSYAVDRAAKTAEVSLYGFAPSRSLYRPGYGATLIHDSEAAMRAQPLAAPMKPPADHAQLPWPDGNASAWTPPGPQQTANLDAALDAVFSEPDREHPRRTRAVIVVHEGRIVAERYAKGFTIDSRLAGWSMTKSVTNALIGILVRQGKLNIREAAPVPEWQQASDPRKKITTDQLLRMSSGLEFSEDYFNPFSDVTRMLFTSGDAATVAAAKPLAHAPDKVWAYSSGTTNILARIVKQVSGDATYADFANRELFAPIGMYSAEIGADESGNFIGSSLGWATARDWARFGLLYLNDGVWNGQRILPEGWVRYSVTPTSAAPTGNYGAQWWLNAGRPGDPKSRFMPEVPSDVYFASGFEGQMVFVVPSRNAVVVRLGLTQADSRFPWQDFLKRIIQALPQTSPNSAAR